MHTATVNSISWSKIVFKIFKKSFCEEAGGIQTTSSLYVRWVLVELRCLPKELIAVFWAHNSQKSKVQQTSHRVYPLR